MSDFIPTRADLEAAVGGAQELRELADPSRSGTADNDLITRWLQLGSARVRGRVEVKHDPEAIAQMDSLSIQLLRTAATSCAARLAYWEGGKGRTMPEYLQQRCALDDAFLADVATGAQRLGRVAGGKQAGINQPSGVVDFDANVEGISIANFKGSGFR